MQPIHCRRIVLAAALLLSVAPALAQPRPHPGHGPRHDGGEPLRRVLDQLDLSQDQREQIHAVLAQRREAMRGRKEQMRERHLALMDAVHAEPFDEAAIRDAAAAVSVTQAELAVERAAILRDVRAVLTPEQREEARQILERRIQVAGSAGPTYP